MAKNEEIDDLGFIEDVDHNDVGFTPDSSSENMNDRQLEALGRGAIRGATFDFYDEASGATQSGLDKLQRLLNEYTGLTPKSPTQVSEELLAQGFKGDIGPTQDELYSQVRDEQRQLSKSLEQEYPMTTLAGGVAGGLATAPLMPGAGLATSTTLGGKVAAGLAAGATGGALYGAGQSEAESLPELATDVAKSTALGAATGVALPLAIPIAKLPYTVPKKIGQLLKETNIGKKATEAYKIGKETGENIVGTENAERIANELASKARKSAKIISRVGDKLAKKKSKLLEDSKDVIDISDEYNKLVEEASSILPLGKTAKSDITRLQDLSKDMVELGFLSPEGLPVQEAAKLSKRTSGMAGFKSGSSESELSTPEGLQAIKQFGGAVKNKVQETVPGLKNIDQSLAGMRNALEEGGLGKASETLTDYMSGRDIKTLTNNVSNLIEGIEQKGVSGAKKRQSLERVFDAISEVEPNIASKLKGSFENLAKRYDVSQAATGLEGSFTTQNPVGIRTALVASGNIAGRGVKKVSDSFNELLNLPPENLKAKAAKLAQSSSVAGKEAARVINEASGSSDDKRKALLFGLMQSPAYREIIMKEDNNQEDSDVK